MIRRPIRNIAALTADERAYVRDSARLMYAALWRHNLRELQVDLPRDYFFGLLMCKDMLAEWEDAAWRGHDEALDGWLLLSRAEIGLLGEWFSWHL
jgi:hypothetical protein